MHGARSILAGGATPTPLTADLVVAAHDGFDDLVWFRNAAVPADFVARSGAAELIGPDGSIPSDDFRFGLFLIDADSDYQRHRHAADEIYLVIGGRAEWRVESDASWSARTAGQWMDVASMTPHAIRTGAEPVAMLYSWTGDITFDSYEVDLGHAHW